MSRSSPLSLRSHVLRRRRGSRSNSPFGDEDMPVTYFEHGLNDNIEARLSSPKRTAFVYDERMLLHKNMWDELYFERPERTKSCFEYLNSIGLLDNCLKIEAKEIQEDNLLLIHQPEHINLVRSTEHMTENQLKALSSEHDYVYFNKHTNNCANLAAGSAIEVLKSILDNRAKNGFCLIRPPGHHAMESDACGFCIYNNAAIAAKYALSNHFAQKILIVDWDVHHGQATQYQFYNTSKVLYISIHRYENQYFWPKLREGNCDFIGSNEGRGFNINLPLHKTHMNNSDYLSLFNNIIVPVAYEYNPDLVIVSAGYDCAIGCPEGEMNVHPACFAHMTHKLMDLARGKVLVVLEGGYCIDSLTHSVAMTLSTLMGMPPPKMEPLDEPQENIKALIHESLKHIQFYWKSLSVNFFENQEPYPDFLNHLPINSWNSVKTPVFPIETNPNKNTKNEEITRTIEELRVKNKIISYPNRTCFVYDCRMENHMNERSHHPESPRRTQMIYESLRDNSIINHCKHLESRFANKEELSLIHSTEYIERLEAICNEDAEIYHQYEESLNSIFINQHSYLSALLACGSLLNVIDEVCTGKSQNGFAVIRPPGHHAEAHCAMGFCFFNNVAVSAQYALEKFPDDIKRILIVDWDVHHGNGTQHQFWTSKNVLYISLHRYDNALFFPNCEDACSSKVGEGEGAGYNVNIAWNKRPIRDSEYISAFNHVVMPIAHEFNPDLVIVSSGFDAARGDQLGGLTVTPECYGHMTQMLSCLANGKLILALEGGYNLNVISECMSHCVCSLLGYPSTPLTHFPPNKNGIDAIRKTISNHMPYWNNLKKHPEPLTIYTEVTPFKVNQPTPINEQQLQSHTLLDSMHNLAIVEVGFQTEQSIEESLSQHPIDMVAVEPSVQNFLESPQHNDTNSGGATTSHIPNTHNQASSSISPNMPNVDRASGASPLSSNVPTLIRDGTSVGLSLNTLMSLTNIQNSEIHNFLGLASTDPLPAVVYAVEPLTWCPHLAQVQQSPTANEIDVHAQCSQCPSNQENWLCLTCYQIYCGRFVQGHMLEHFNSTRHPLVLSFADLSSWCYECEAYIHNEILSSAKREAHIAKFGVSQPNGSSLL